MSMTYIILSVLIGLVLLGSVLYVSYLFESMKSRKAMLLAKAGDKVQKYQKFLDILPEGTLPKEVQMVLIEEIIHNLQQILKIDQDPKANRLLQSALEQQKIIAKQKDKPPKVPKAKDMQAAKEIQLHFKNLFKLLKFIGATRKHHTKVINKNLKILQNLYVETGAKVHRDTAEAAIQQSKSKLALYHLNQAIAEYARTDAKKFTNEIKALRNRANQLDQAMKQQKKETQAKQDKEAPTTSKPKKDRGLDRMFDENASNSAKKRL